MCFFAARLPAYHLSMELRPAWTLHMPSPSATKHSPNSLSASNWLPTLAAEPQGKLILWRCIFVTHLLVILVLGSFYWGQTEGLSLARRRAEAFNVLVFGEIGEQQGVRGVVLRASWTPSASAQTGARGIG